MRALVKESKPTVLVVNESKWTANYVAGAQAGDGRPFEKWRHPEIKGALKAETRAKCAYCEAFLADVSYPHVEHLRPKSLYPELAHTWDNMTSACGPCNTAKGDFHDATLGLLNPYVDDPIVHLESWGHFMDWVLGSARGEITITKLHLNRLDLANSRMMRLQAVRNMLERWHDADGILKEVLADGIRLDLTQGEFTSSVHAFLLAKGFPVEA